MAGGFKAFPIELDEHLLTVLRYVERNPVRAGLVKCGEQWSWSSARYWKDGEGKPVYLVPGPVERPKNWLEWVKQPLTARELADIRQSVARGAPYGDAGCALRTAKKLGLESSLRPRDRPRKSDDKRRS